MKPQVTDRVSIAKKWIDAGYKAARVLYFVGLSQSTYYEFIKREDKVLNKSDIHKPSGRPVPGYSYNSIGEKISDYQIKEWLCDSICGDGFPYGYKKLTVCLREEHNLTINSKKVYRLCHELDILRPQRVVSQRHPRHLARRENVSAPNELWEMDIKYGYIYGQDKFFFQLTIIDVFDRTAVDYYLGLSCTAENACNVLKNSLEKRGLSGTKNLPKIRTDNGPQFISHKFEELCDALEIIHQRIPVKTPNMNAHIESFHSILEDECYSRNEFHSFKEAYTCIGQYMDYYNTRRIHGSIKYMAPAKFYEAFMNKNVSIKAFAA